MKNFRRLIPSRLSVSLATVALIGQAMLGAGGAHAQTPEEIYVAAANACARFPRYCYLVPNPNAATAWVGEQARAMMNQPEPRYCYGTKDGYGNTIFRYAC